MSRLIIIAGPTAVGKTAYAVELAQKLGTEIVSCDSRQFYRELKIGVARPTDDEQAAARHHYVACRSVSEPYDVYRFGADARKTIARLFESHDTVIAAGGSGLYIQALTGSIAAMPDPAPGLRDELKQRLRDEGLESLRRQLQQLDPDYYARVDLANPARIQRALEVCLTTGRPYSELLRQPVEQPPFEVDATVLTADTDTLRQRIDSRVDAMMAAGLKEEVEGLLPLRHLNTLNTVGYRELMAAADGTISLDKAVSDIKINTWHYAKKQLTWLRKYMKTARWISH
ncbi:MAG: tRNA (adenosine(37)-N6)-dimethylallyltransferase MiaA [Bacteroidales bacterium]|nr:tRNA (adenosine(37)-N6)-dimethylallyltransferase MiaA [Bacteroidales bacterium]